MNFSFILTSQCTEIGAFPASRLHRESTDVYPKTENGSGMKRVLLLLLLATAALGQTPSSMVVTTQWLAARLGRPDIVIVQVGPDRKQYDVAHIPGARFLALSRLRVARDA